MNEKGILLSSRKVDLIIFILALVLRGVYAFAAAHCYPYAEHLSSDVQYYLQWAEDLAFHPHSKAEIFWGLPLFPYTLAVLLRLTLNHVEIVRLFFLFLGSVNCVLVANLGRRLFSHGTGALAGILCATNFILMYYDWLLMPVPLLVFLTLVILYALSIVDQQTAFRPWFFIGLLWGLAACGDGKFLLALPLFFLYRSLARSPVPVSQRWIHQLIPLLIGCILVVGSVTLRNFRVSGDWVLLSAQSGLSFYAGNNPDAEGVYENPEFIRPSHKGQDEDQRLVAQALQKRALGPGAVSRFWRDQALAFIRRHPQDYLRLLGRKARLFFTNTERAHDLDLIFQRPWREKWDVNPLEIIFPLALWGFFFAWRARKQETAPVILIIVSQFLFTLMFFLTTRHRASILPLLILLESVALIHVFRYLFQRRFLLPAMMGGTLLIWPLFLPRQFLEPKEHEFLRATKNGVIALKNNQPVQAIPELQHAIRLRPYDSNALFNLGNAYLALEKLPEAREAYQKSLAVCDYNLDARFNLGYTYEIVNQPQKAIEQYRQVLHYAPRSLDAHFRIAHLYEKQGLCAQARPHVEAILQEKPFLKNDLKDQFPHCSELFASPPDN